MYDSSMAYMLIQMNGPVKDHILDYSELYKRGVEELADYLEGFR